MCSPNQEWKIYQCHISKGKIKYGREKKLPKKCFNLAQDFKKANTALKCSVHQANKGVYFAEINRKITPPEFYDKK